jgi:hypothetical protein
MAIGLYPLGGAGSFVFLEMSPYRLGTIDTDKLLTDLWSNCSHNHSGYA